MYNPIMKNYINPFFSLKLLVENLGNFLFGTKQQKINKRNTIGENRVSFQSKAIIKSNCS